MGGVCSSLKITKKLYQHEVMILYSKKSYGGVIFFRQANSKLNETPKGRKELFHDRQFCRFY